MSDTYYDPERAPNPAEWLALEGSQRLRLVLSYHVAARTKGPKNKIHALSHVGVENRVASGHGPACRAIERLQQEGLSRHDAVHAVASVLTDFAFLIYVPRQPQVPGSVERRVNAAIEALNASDWRARAKFRRPYMFG